MNRFVTTCLQTCNNLCIFTSDRNIDYLSLIVGQIGENYRTIVHLMIKVYTAWHNVRVYTKDIFWLQRVNLLNAPVGCHNIFFPYLIIYLLKYSYKQVKFLLPTL